MSNYAKLAHRVQDFAAWTQANRKAGETKRLNYDELMAHFRDHGRLFDPGAESIRTLHALDANGVCTECEERPLR